MPGLDVRIEQAVGREEEEQHNHSEEADDTFDSNQIATTEKAAEKSAAAAAVAMDSNRRGPRYVIDPKVRQVGFVTPGSEPLVPNPSAAILGNSPSPVIIPPRLPDLPSKASPLPVPSPPPRRQPSIEIPLQGSYNPADSVLGTSPISSPLSKNDSNGRYPSVPSESLDLSPSSLSRANSGMERLSLKDEFAERPTSSRLAASSTGELPGAKQQQQQPAVPASPRSLPPPRVALPPPGVQAPTKSLKERTSKAERRAKQEADREAKRAARENAGGQLAESEAGTAGGLHKEGKSSKGQSQKKDGLSEKKLLVAVEKKGGERAPEKEKKKEVPAPRMQFDDEHRVAKARKRSLIEQTETKNRVELFRHLPQFVHGTQLPSLEAKFFHDDPMHPHPAVYQVGLQYLTGDIVGGNARCVAMLLAFREIIKDYSTPKEKTLIRDLTAKINSHVSFLISCRPLSISMGNAIKFLKTRIAKLPVSLTEAESKSMLIAEIDRFIQEKITFADKEITKHAVTKITDGDVILTYASSCVVEMIILHAFELGRKFRVIIVDSRPKLEGKGLLRRLLGRGISCTYTHINAISYIMQEVTRVFLGASSVLSNGTVYSRVGSACVAMVAHAFHVPVMICCETYKFHERVQLDSICSNELGDPDALVKVPGRKDLSELEGWSQSAHLQLLNLTYDATPADYVSMIITELGMVPPTSVPVILREYRKEPML